MNTKIRQIYAAFLSGIPQAKGSIGTEDQSQLLLAVDFLVKRAVDEEFFVGLKKKKIKLREDAKVLMVLLLRDMVLVPVLTAKVKTMIQAVDALEHDLDTIIGAVRPDKLGEVSAHSLLQAIESSWDELRFTAWKIWG